MVLIGRLTKDATVNHVKKQNRDVVNFTLAINDSYKPKGADKPVTHTTYIDCSYWMGTTIARLLTKGSLVEVTGRIAVHGYKTFEDKIGTTINGHVDAIKIHQYMKGESKQIDAPSPAVVKDDLPF